MINHMNTLIVIEDEIAVRRSIIGKIKREKLSLTIQGEFQYAEEAYEHIKQNNPPEIVLLDMRMPGMGGMKFLEILSKEFSEIQVIVLSGYSEFEYLQKAIKCGAKDYLLKPVVREELKNALEKAMTNVKKIHQQRKEEEKLELFLRNHISLVKANLINKFIQGAEKSDIIKDLKHFEEFSSFKSYLFINGKIKNFSTSKKLSQNACEMIEGMLAKLFDTQHILSNVGSIQNEDNFQCIVGLKETEGMVLSQFKTKLEESLVNINDTENIALHLSISNLYHDLFETRNQYVETIFTTFTQGSQPSICFVTGVHDKSAKPFVKQEEMDQMVCYVRDYNRKRIVLTVNKWFKSLFKERQDLVFAQQLSFEILNTIEGAIVKDSKSVNLSSDHDMLKFYDSIKTYKTIEDVKYKVISSLITKAEKLEKKQNKQTNDLILVAKQIIDEKYYKEITLESVANKLHLNKSYLSELFKEEIGLTFNKYLNWVRIEKAKELLIVHGLSPSKIPELVGYKDYVYFSIVFKKFTGHPPGEFKQRNKDI
ncbi:response regulator transcription factor [Metabacillus litoralis]|uniref:response regulator transcription factor n=1 Tax=Metabacillus litoralis TaxID=152268 RepID=UPI002042112D|nr:response regulator [Metabacillus litoralis]MCM3409585.1 response regulator [Metabacillus litoralis]